MPAQNECNERVSFSTSTWVTLIGLVGTGVGTNLILIYSMSGEVQNRIDTLDMRWQDRIAAISREFKTDLKGLEMRIAPDWLVRQVEANTREIHKVEDEFTRDFVRHSELQTILNQRLKEERE